MDNAVFLVNHIWGHDSRIFNTHVRVSRAQFLTFGGKLVSAYAWHPKDRTYAWDFPIPEKEQNTTHLSKAYV